MRVVPVGAVLQGREPIGERLTGPMPGKLRPGTPSMSAGSRGRANESTCARSSSLWTRIVTVSPSRQRSMGPGSEPLTTVAIRRAPVRLAARSPIARSKAAPCSTCGLGHRRKLRSRRITREGRGGGACAQAFDESSSGKNQIGHAVAPRVRGAKRLVSCRKFKAASRRRWMFQQREREGRTSKQ